MDDVELLCLQAFAYELEEFFFEKQVADALESRVCSPAFAAVAAEELREAVEGSCDIIVVRVEDFREGSDGVFFDGGAVSRVGGECHAEVGAGAEGAGEVVANEGDASPFGVAGFGDEEQS